MNWDELFIRQAMLIAEKSKDPSTKVGCVIVGQDNAILSMGFNGFPRGVHEEDVSHDRAGPDGDPAHPFAYLIEKRVLNDRWDRPQKYSWVEHAERNAIYNAARHGIKIAGAKAYLNWEPHPCADCCRGLIQAGIVEIIGPDIVFPGTGSGTSYHITYSQQMCEEANVFIRRVPWDKQV